MTNFENLSVNQKIRATLHRDVYAVCTEICHLLGLEITKPAMELIAELVHKKISTYGLDLEAFANHAKRVTINSDDVKLLVRRNPSMKTHVNSIRPNQKEKRRPTLSSVKPPDTLNTAESLVREPSAVTTDEIIDVDTVVYID